MARLPKLLTPRRKGAIAGACMLGATAVPIPNPALATTVATGAVTTSPPTEVVQKADSNGCKSAAATLKGSVLKDEWEEPKPEQLACMKAGEASYFRADLGSHWTVPLGWALFLPDAWVKRGVESWESFEAKHDYPSPGTEVDASDIAAGYAGIRWEANIGNPPPEMYPNIEAFYAAYPGIKDADVNGPLVGEMVARFRARGQAPVEVSSEERTGAGVFTVMVAICMLLPPLAVSASLVSNLWSRMRQSHAAERLLASLPKRR